MGNARFSREQAYVSVDTKKIKASQTVDLYVNHDSRSGADCYREWRR